jgi:hypothetical protein
MLGTARLLTFAFRALVLLLLLSLLWVGVASGYNDTLVFLAGPLASGEITLDAVGSHILIDAPDRGSPVSIDGLTLHYGLVLVLVVVLAAVDLKLGKRLAWLVALVALSFVLHIIGVALLARGVGWSVGSESPEDSGRLVFSLFAVFWGLLPALIGGVWCFAYWLPGVTSTSSVAHATDDTADAKTPVGECPP